MADPDPQTAQGDLPEALGKYQVVDEVAEGRLTQVLRARLEGIAGFQRHFAIRRLRGAAAQDDDAVRIVEEEVRAVASLAHSNIVQVLDLGHDARGVLYVVTEWVDGWSLEEVLDRCAEEGRAVPATHVTWLGLQLARALAWSHSRPRQDDPERSVLHDGVAAGNVLVSRSGEVKLADFGLAHAARRIEATSPDLVPAGTDPVPPEREAGSADSASDVWSLAVTLRGLLAGTRPTTADPVAPLPSDLPEPLAEMLNRAIAEDPADRPSLSEVEAALQEPLHGAVSAQEDVVTWLRDLFGESELRSDEAPPRDMSEEHELPFADDDDGLDLGEADGPERTAPRVGRSDHDDDDDDIKTAVAATHAPPPRREGTEPSVSASAHGADDLDLDAEPAPAAPASASDAPPTPTGPGYAVAVAMLVVGLLLGGSAGYALVPPPAPVAPPGASLEVVVADGTAAEVAVNGSALTGPTPLPPGRHRVDITFDGDRTWQGEVELAEGTRRLLVLDPRTVAEADTDAASDEAPE